MEMTAFAGQRLSPPQLRHNASSAGKASELKRRSSVSVRAQASSNGTATDPLLLRAARGEPVPRPPAWMMRQAGRYMKVYQDLSKKHPSFRERSEVAELAAEVTLQPWRAFQPDGVILFSDILTPLTAMGVPFDIDESKGPVIHHPIRSTDDLKTLRSINLSEVEYVQKALQMVCQEVAGQSTILGFVGAPWTLATYCVEGGTTRTYTVIKSMIHSAPELLRSLLSHLAKEIGEYAAFQVDSGAQCIQVFDSWGGQLPPATWEAWSKPFITELISTLKSRHPNVPVVLYINGNGGLIERMATTGADIIGLDWTLDMADARRRIAATSAVDAKGIPLGVQGNVDPALLFASPEAVTEGIYDCVRKAGTHRHILNLGHGVLVGTPEENVLHFFNTARSLSYDSLAAGTQEPPELEPVTAGSQWGAGSGFN